MYVNPCHHDILLKAIPQKSIPNVPLLSAQQRPRPEAVLSSWLLRAAFLTSMKVLWIPGTAVAMQSEWLTAPSLMPARTYENTTSPVQNLFQNAVPSRYSKAVNLKTGSKEPVFSTMNPTEEVAMMPASEAKVPQSPNI